MYCPECKRHFEGRFCPECGTKLVEDPNSTNGFNINLGDANAINGGINLYDSHNVQNVDNSVQNITNNSSVFNNITNVERQKTESEILQEKKMQFNLFLDEVLSDNVITEDEKVALKSYQQQIGLDDTIAQLLIDNARRRVHTQSRQESLGAAAGPVRQLTSLFLSNQVDRVKSMIPRMSALARNFKVDEVQHKYYVALAALDPAELIRLHESDVSDNYWRCYWAYIAYRKLGQNDKAEDILWGRIPNFETYSEENTYLLQCVGDIADFGEKAALDTLNTVTDNYSPELRLFANALYMRLDPEKAAALGASKDNCAFYNDNILSLETPEARDARLAKERAEAAANARKAAAVRTSVNASANARGAIVGSIAEKHRLDEKKKAEEKIKAEAAYRLKVDKNKLNFPAIGGTQIVNVSCGRQWKITQDLVYFGQVKVQGNTISIQIDANKEQEERSSWIIIMAGLEKQRIDIVQCASAFEYSGTTRESDSSSSLKSLHEKIANNAGEDWRLAAFLDSDEGVFIKGSNGASVRSIPQEMKDVIWACNGYISSVTLNSKGDYCVVIGDSDCKAEGPESFLDALNVCLSKIGSVSINDNRDYVLIAEGGYKTSSASLSSILEKARGLFGNLRKACLSNKGICILCDCGVYYENIPQIVADELKILNFRPENIFFTDSGHYFFSNDNGRFSARL